MSTTIEHEHAELADGSRVEVHLNGERMDWHDAYDEGFVVAADYEGGRLHVRMRSRPTATLMDEAEMEEIATMPLSLDEPGEEKKVYHPEHDEYDFEITMIREFPESSEPEIPHGVLAAKGSLEITMKEWENLTNEERFGSIESTIEELENAKREVPDDWR